MNTSPHWTQTLFSGLALEAWAFYSETQTQAEADFLVQTLAPTRGARIADVPCGDGRLAVVADGRPSVTHYDTIEAFRAASLVTVGLETGRTHQIRVHMAALRHPCCGDLLYGADPVLAAHLGLTRQWLHAVRLSFEHPATGLEITFESPYPDDLQHALDVLRAES